MCLEYLILVFYVNKFEMHSIELMGALLIGRASRVDCSSELKTKPCLSISSWILFILPHAADDIHPNPSTVLALRNGMVTE
jgi:hypothetical protein